MERLGKTHNVKDVKPLMFDKIPHDSVVAHCVQCNPTCTHDYQAIWMHHREACRYFGEDMQPFAEEVIIWREMGECIDTTDVSERLFNRQKRELFIEMAKSSLLYGLDFQ